MRYYASDKSRAGAVARHLLAVCRSILITDFYAAYGQLPNTHQSCWVHLLRDLHALKEAQPHDWHVIGWARAVRHLYDSAQAELARAPAPTLAQRAALADLLDARLQHLGRRFARRRGHPCRTLAQRLLRHQGQLFTFVRTDGVSADNNPAERTLRPLVIMRKISGGSRSAQGSATPLGWLAPLGPGRPATRTPLPQASLLLASTFVYPNSGQFRVTAI